MRKITSYLLYVASFLLSPLTFAGTSFEPLLNQVTLQVSADKWIKTTTPLVTIGINVSVKDQDMGDLQSGLMGHLQKIAPGAEWHIITFNRTEDPSGLEKIDASAEARVPETKLSGLRDRVKANSQPGQTYTLISVAFTPTDDELRAATQVLRENIYQQVSTEVTKLSSLFSGQKYYLHQLNFLDQLAPQPIAAQNAMFAVRQAKMSGSDMPVSNHVVLNAQAVLAAAPGHEIIELVHGDAVPAQASTIQSTK